MRITNDLHLLQHDLAFLLLLREQDEHRPRLRCGLHPGFLSPESVASTENFDVRER